ncbi:MAG: DUF5615 family PIN-like protein [Verrucomicrobiota bacterium]
MIRFPADENFNNNLLHATRQRNPEIEFTRIQDLGMVGVSDPDILQWAADHDYVLLTHDAKTIPMHFADRLDACGTTPGVIVVHQSAETSRVVSDLILLALCMKKDELEGRVEYLPLK